MLARHGYAPSKRYSQNFLVTEGVVEGIAEAVALAEGERVIELGPGAGTLTTALLRRGANVLAIEKDPRMLALLREELADVERFELREGDAAALDLAALTDTPIAVTGNLPYAITGSIFRGLVAQKALVARSVVMVQREVRDRLLAAAGESDYGALTVFVTAAFRVEPVMTVKPGAFFPPPKVTSAVVRLVPHAVPRAEETEGFRRVVRAAFDKRRKTLRNALSGLAAPEVLAAAFESAEVDPGLRGETLDVEAFARLAAAIEG
ncbi:MAG: ribosomal RNA small subunit methyltransferase A [Sandaracinus sp.]|nr:ribosomal RNA small subunit methyltransferase A [Myxococcales bacterium]MCB9611869.1 ribosomal RNA small subunit methyltransferase A [Sandaracinus sp.]MCB9620901.1 ribosomal RNA small subunit methyltransferase A [Sandaracinus sp.]MCB9625028.1 ribosomal RNA small subunit methyltransferase A [Sandaracinus sp.]